MKEEIICKNKTEAKKLLRAEEAAWNKKHPRHKRSDYEMFHPTKLYVYPEGELEYSLWNGMRRFKGCDWATYAFIAANADHTRIHLSEYWGDASTAGIYVKEK